VETPRVEVEMDEETRKILERTQQIFMPSHEEVLLWVTQDPVPTEADSSRVSEPCSPGDELERVLKRKRTTQERLLRRLNGVHEPQ
jgi:hypothetical protein